MHPAPFDSLFSFGGGGDGVRVLYVFRNSFFAGPWRSHRKELIDKSAEQARMLSQFLGDTNFFLSYQLNLSRVQKLERKNVTPYDAVLPTEG